MRWFIDPGTITLILTALSAAAKAGGSILGAKSEKKFAKKKAKELKRSTYADLLSNALQRGSDLEGHGLQSSARQSRRKSDALMNTAAAARESINI